MALSSRVCIFCGERPQAKNNEHILPEWLLRFTGNPKRVVTHFFDIFNDKEHRYAFDQFRFPACEICNEGFGVLEEQAKPIIEKLNRDKIISGQEYVTLLDWLDKIRTGMWLARMYLEKSFDDIRPNFFIAKRVALKDRSIFIYRFPTNVNGLNVIGFETFFFKFMPSAFGLKINQIFLINISYDSAFSKYLGCYYLQDVFYDLDEKILKYHGLAFGSKRPQKIAPFFGPESAIFQSIVDLPEQVVWGSSYYKLGHSFPILLRGGELRELTFEEYIEPEINGLSDAFYFWQVICFVYHLQIQISQKIKFSGSLQSQKINDDKLKVILKENVARILALVEMYSGKKLKKASWLNYSLRQFV